jgi:proteasome alpha subunit
MDPLTLLATAKVSYEALKAGIVSAAGGATPATEPRVLGPATLEVAILDANRPRRAFRRITGPALEALLPSDLIADAPESGE